MNSADIKNRYLQTDLLRNASNMLQAVACMDDASLRDISNIVVQIDELADKMEERIGEPEVAPTPDPTQRKSPKLTLVSP
ncbi:MAG: hypothetical protein L3J65_00365 [Robiginitomaculum sp.]|nr:hypothetical protein [Robiginitomaculum sp.]